MRIINPKFEIINQNPGIEGILEQIKIAGQTCYDSEYKRTPKEFTDMLIKSGHGAMLEHGTVYLYTDIREIASRYLKNKFSIVHEIILLNKAIGYYITTNYRVLVENGWIDDIKYFTEPLDYHEKRVTVRFTTQIAISREYNGHVSIVKPTWVSDLIKGNEENIKVELRGMCQAIYLSSDIEEWDAIMYWLFSNLVAEYSYLNMLRLGRTAQEARTVLPLDTRTELVHTAFISDWKHFFDLRALGTTGKPHPDAKILAEPLMKEFERLKLI